MNIETESRLLGGLLLDPEAFVQVAHMLQPEDFSLQIHSTIYEAMLSLSKRHKPVTMDGVRYVLQQRGQLEAVGGMNYLTALSQRSESSGSLEAYGQIVKNTALLRRLAHVGEQIHRIAAQEQDAEIALDKALQALFDVRKGHIGFATQVSDVVANYLENLNQLHKRRGAVVGVPTGFRDLDAITGGLQRSDLIIIAAPPSVGKTSLALSIALNAAVKYRHTIGLFSLEMNRHQVVQRLLAMSAGIDQQRIRTGQMEQEEWKRLTAAAEAISHAKIWIDDTAVLSTVQLRTRARHFVEANSVRLIVVDYVHLMQSNVNGKRHENRVQEIGEISRTLKVIARELNVPVLALAQMSRAVESRPSKFPQLSDLRDGSLENDADVVLFLYRDELYQPESEYKNIATLILAKHRNGLTAELDIYFQPSQTHFRDLALVPFLQSNMESPL